MIKTKIKEGGTVLSRNLKRCVAIALCLFLTLTVYGLVYAKEPSKTVRVGYVLVDRYQEGGEGERKTGYGYEYLQRISDLTGWEYEYVYGSFSELFEKLNTGEIDLMGNISYTEDRAKNILFSDIAQGKENYYLYVNEDLSDINPNNVDEVSQLVVGVTANSFQDRLFSEWIEEKGHNVTVKRYSGATATLDAINNGEINAFVSTEFFFEGFNYVPITSIGFSDFYLCVAKDRPDLLDELNDALRRMHNGNPFFNENLYNKYNRFSSVARFLGKAEKKWLEENDNTIRVGFLKNNMPYIGIKEDGELTGVIPKIFETMNTTFGINVETEAFDNIYDLQKALESGQLDLAGPLLSDFWLMEQDKLTSSNAIFSTSLLFAHRESTFNENPKVIAYSYDNAVQLGVIKSQFPNAQLLKRESREECLKAVVNGYADATPITSIAMNLYKQYDDFGKLHITEMFQVIEIVLASSKGNTAPLEILNKAIYASKDKLQGATLSDSIYVKNDITISSFLDEYMKEFTTLLIFILLVVICLAVYYRGVVHKMKRMQATNRVLHTQAYRDEMTKVGNRTAYMEKEQILDDLLKKGKLSELALVVIDINGLKWVNDNLGHEAGDMLIQNTSASLCRIFRHSPVYRTGGDEFAIVLEGSDFNIRDELINKLKNDRLNECFTAEDLSLGKFSASLGMAELDINTDKTIQEVHTRADKEMYKDKKEIKKNCSKFETR